MSDEISQTIYLLREKRKKLEKFNIEQSVLVAMLRRSEDMSFAEKQHQEARFTDVQMQLQEARKHAFLSEDYSELQDDLTKRLNKEEELQEVLEEMTKSYENLLDRSDDRVAELVDQLHSMNNALVNILEFAQSAWKTSMKWNISQKYSAVDIHYAFPAEIQQARDQRPTFPPTTRRWVWPDSLVALEMIMIRLVLQFLLLSFF